MGRAHDIDAYCSREREDGWEERMISMRTAVKQQVTNYYYFTPPSNFQTLFSCSLFPSRSPHLFHLTNPRRCSFHLLTYPHHYSFTFSRPSPHIYFNPKLLFACINALQHANNVSSVHTSPTENLNPSIGGAYTVHHSHTQQS